MRKTLKWLIAGLLLALAGRVAFVVVNGTGMLETYEPVLADTCRQVVVAPGAEDVTIDHATGQVFVSADDRRVRGASASNGIYMFTLGAPDQVTKFSGAGPENFRPHGISLWKGENGERRLFVVSHRGRGDHVIEIFNMATDGNLTHAETIANPLIHSPNDLVATGERSFYVTNDHGWTGAWRQVEDFLAIPVSNVVWYNGGAAVTVIDGLAYANGINISADGETLYVAEITRRQIRAWHRQADGRFKAGDAWPMRMSADNIELDPAGRLWTAGHPDALAFLKHAGDPAALSPSMASVVDPASGDITEVLYTDGSELSGSSVAAYSNGTLVIGSVFEDKLLVCKADQLR